MLRRPGWSGIQPQEGRVICQTPQIVAAVVGDRGFAMQLGEFSTAVRYRIPSKVLVIKIDMLTRSPGSR